MNDSVGKFCDQSNFEKENKLFAHEALTHTHTHTFASIELRVKYAMASCMIVNLKSMRERERKSEHGKKIVASDVINFLAKIRSTKSHAASIVWTSMACSQPATERNVISKIQ